jgi:uncharacterized membrane protein
LTDGHNTDAKVDPRLKTGNLLLLFTLGFALVVAGTIILAFSTFLSGGGSGSYGIIVFIGPIPIVVGGGPQALLLILLGVVLAALSVAVFVFTRKSKRF